GLLAAAFVWTAGRLRGRPSLADLFGPIVLLELGQAPNLLWGWQLEFFASAVLAGVALLAIAGGGRTLALAVLPDRWTGAQALRGDRLLLALGGGSLALTALYFGGWERVPYHPRSAGVYQTLKTSAQFVTIGLGPAARALWPVPGILVLALFAATAVLLARAWAGRPGERARAGGLLLFLGAMASLALGLGLGRNGFEVRYVTLAVPAWCCAYLAWVIYGSSGAGRRIPAGLALVAALALWSNAR